MTRALAIAVAIGVAFTGCKRTTAPVKITQFSANPTFIPKGIPGKLCYGVENAAKVDLDPPVEQLLPAAERCIDISPAQATTYTLSAWAVDGSKVSKSLSVRVGNPPPRISDLAAVPNEVKSGSEVIVCFQTENTRSIKVNKGKLLSGKNCLRDYPKKTTTYKITALGADREEDTGTVTVQVH